MVANFGSISPRPKHTQFVMKSSLRLSLLLSAAAGSAFAARKAFSIHDDILAYPQVGLLKTWLCFALVLRILADVSFPSPQFDVFFPEEYILDSEAAIRLRTSQTHDSPSDPSITTADRQEVGYRSSQQPLQDDRHAPDGSDPSSLPQTYDYEEMMLDNRRYLCQIPIVEANDTNSAADDAEAAKKKALEEEKELVRATDRGLELLQEMEGTCMYYVSGWWSYSFCYKKEVRQFHALAAGAGIPTYPPVADPATHAYVLGRFHSDDEDDDYTAAERSRTTGEEERPKADATELQTKGESRYLVQRLGGGTICDLTGKERKIEVQFHCHPQTTDRIGWIKEITTCSYLMVIYTPRLCHDVAFQLPQPEDVYPIECREILSSDDEITDWKKMKAHRASQKLVNSGAPEFPVIGGIEVGAMKLVGTEGRRIEKGRVASAGEERVQVVAQRENGKLQRLPKEQLKKFGLEPEEIEQLKNQLEDLANGKDWRLEVVEANGERGYRGIVDTDEDDELFEEYAQEKAPAKDHGKLRGKEKDQAAVNDKAKSEKKPKTEKKISKPKKEDPPTQKKKTPEGEDKAEEETGSEEIFHEEL